MNYSEDWFQKWCKKFEGKELNRGEVLNFIQSIYEETEIYQQIKAGWERGYIAGIFIGVLSTLVGGFLIKILW